MSVCASTNPIDLVGDGGCEPSCGADEVAIRARGLGVSYHGKPAVRDVSLDIAAHRVTAVIGPSGCGKSSFLSCLNRLTDLTPGCTVEGELAVAGQDTRRAYCDTLRLRQTVGMIFQKPNPFAMSIRKNVEMPLKEHGVRHRAERHALCEQALRDVGLWDEVKDRLHASALSLSGGQQQRLCIARALALRPRVLLMDEPCSALDPMATGVVEALIRNLRDGCCATDAGGEPLTLVVVTHNLAQAQRIADDVAVFWIRGGAGVMIESGPTERVFADPQAPETKRYIAGLSG